MNATATQTPIRREPWYVLRVADCVTPPDLPVSTPLAVRVTHAAYFTFRDEIRRDIRAGHNSRRVGIAFDQLDSRQLAPLRLSRRERGDAIAALVKLESSRGGVFL